MDILSNSEVDSVWSETSENNHLLERLLASGLPLSWQLILLWNWASATEPCLPLSDIESDSLSERVETLWQLMLEFGQVTPRNIGDPVLTLGLFHGILVVSKTHTSTKEEQVLFVVEVGISHHLQLDGKLECQQELMAFEQGLTCGIVNIQDVLLVDLCNLVVLSTRRFLGFRNRLREQVLIPGQTELIHWVDLVKIDQHEEEGSSHFTAWTELLTSLINLLHTCLGILKTLLHISLGLLGHSKNLDEFDVVYEWHI